MIPLFILDGAKVYDWNKKIWIVVFASMVALFIATGFIL